MSRAGFACRGVGCVGWVGKGCMSMNMIVFRSAGVVYYRYILYTGVNCTRWQWDGEHVRVVFLMGGRAGGWVGAEWKKPTEKTTRRRLAQRPREKNFGAHTLQLRAPRLTYCETRCFFRFSFYFSPPRGDGETVFPRFSSPSSRVTSENCCTLGMVILND